MGHWNRPSGAALALAAAAAVAGCGGSGDEGSGSGQATSAPARPEPLVVYHVENHGRPADMRVEANGRTAVRGRVPGGRCPARPRRFRMSANEMAAIKAHLLRVPRTKQRTGTGDHLQALEIRLEARGATFHYVGLHSVPEVILPLVTLLDGKIAFRCGGGL